MGLFETRVAKKSDYVRLVRLCRRAVGNSDYVLRYLREVIQAHTLFVAFHNNQIVGMTNFEKCIDGSGWLSMARTDPSWRRKGAALLLQKTITERARRDRIRTLRLWVLSTNKPALKACRKGGYAPIFRMIHMSQVLRSENPRERLPPVLTIPKPRVPKLKQSSYITKMNGYVAYNWHVVMLDARVLLGLVQRRRFYQVGEAAFLLSIPDHASWNGKRRRLHSEFTLLQGPLRKSLRVVKEIARAYGIRFLGTYLPHNSRIRSLATEEAFRVDGWADHCVVMEKRIM